MPPTAAYARTCTATRTRARCGPAPIEPRASQLFNLGALLVLIVGLILTVAALADGGSKVLPLVLSFIGLALAGVGLRFAIVALGRAPRLGAKGLAVYQLVSASISLLLGVIAVTLGLAP
jgi:dipeptide/tripeptide permease